MAKPYRLPGLFRGRLAAVGGKLSVHHLSNTLMAPVSLWLLCVKINCSKVPYEDFSILLYVLSLSFFSFSFSWCVSLTVYTKYENERSTYDSTGIAVCTVKCCTEREMLIHAVPNSCSTQILCMDAPTYLRCLNVWEEDIESPYTEADRSGLKRCEQLGQRTQMRYRWNCPETKTALF